VNGKAVWTGAVDLSNDSQVRAPLKWKRPRRIFVNSMSDLFHDGLPDAAIDQVFAVMAAAPQHTFQVLTKRPARMKAYVGGALRRVPLLAPGIMVPWPLPNVWLGVSAERQREADERIPLLLATPAAKRFISAEPLLGPLCLDEALMDGHPGRTDIDGPRGMHYLRHGTPRVDWIIAGGESGPGARPMHPDWARSLRDQCSRAGVPFFFKQWGEFASVSEVAGPGAHFSFPDGATVRRVGKKLAGATLDGRAHREFPPSPRNPDWTGP